MKDLIKSNNIYKIIILLLLTVSCASEDKKLFDMALEFQNQTKYKQAIEIYQKIIDEYAEGKYVVNANVKLNQCKNKLSEKENNIINVVVQSNNPSLYIEKIEKSYEKRDIKIYIFSNGQKRLAILGSMHGDEPQGKYIIEQLIGYIKNTSEILNLNDKQILLIPAINPDGLFRKTRANANKVDLNRNFPTKDWKKIPFNQDPAHYPGDKPASEVETRMLIKEITEFKPKIIINIHSPYKVINYDSNALKVAKLMAKYNEYKISDDIGYPTPGSFGTYFGKERNIQVITLETGPDSGKKAWHENKEALIEVIKNLGVF